MNASWINIASTVITAVGTRSEAIRRLVQKGLKA